MHPPIFGMYITNHSLLIPGQIQAEGNEPFWLDGITIKTVLPRLTPIATHLVAVLPAYSNEPTPAAGAAAHRQLSN